MNEKWFSLTVEEIEKKLGTNAASGLSPKAASSRCEERTKKERRTPFFTVKKKSWDKLLFDIIRDCFLVLLLISSLMTLLFEGNYIIGSSMLLLCVINIAICFIMYFRDRRGMESMSDFFVPTARVIRGGKLYIADYRDVVEGDVIFVEKGDVLGCDARLIYSDGLSVIMKTDRKNEKTLQKYANGAVSENELHAENMSNMLHAGSVVQAGSGRAIVVATGEYTYLGAMTGGITEISSQEIPEGLSILKKRTSAIGMILLIAIIPFSIFSLLFANFTGGNILLSSVFTVILAFSASCMLSRLSNVFVGFFSRYIRKAALADNPCIMRSVGDFDKLASLDYLFVLDGSIATDGILHFETMITADGDANGFDKMGSSATMLRDMVGLYNIARTQVLSTGVRSNESLDIGISEFIKKSGVDTEALNIRCQIQSYLPEAGEDKRDLLVYTDKGEQMTLRITDAGNIIEECDCAIFGGAKKPITNDGRSILRRGFDSYAEKGRRMLVFVLCDGASKSFVGMVVLREGVDTYVDKAVKALKKSGVNIISFSNCIGRYATEIPDALMSEKKVAAKDFIKYGLPVTHKFGEFEQYSYLDESMITELAQFVKSQNKTLGVLGFTDYASEAADIADVFITCASIRTGVFGRLDEEIRSLEIPGEQSSASCTQSVRSNADVLLMRPQGGRGGLEPLARVIEYCKAVYRNVSNYMTYLFCVQLMRLVAVLLPRLFGIPTLDARHMLFLGLIMDILAMLVFMGDTRRGDKTCRQVKEEFRSVGFKSFIMSNFKLVVSVAVGSVLTVLLPNIFSLIPLFGAYSYKAEFTFMSLALMQLLTLVCVYSKDLRDTKQNRRLFNSFVFIAQVALIVLFTALCLIFRPIGDFFGVVASPLPYFLLSFVPVLTMGVCYIVLQPSKKKKNM
ncbi:MAG: cation-transporting P-type ATPase [Ruminococcaceae bacterium]|nr:cation-transporting P-type ATPase [Oscillospiraceae bacterium]